MTNYQELVNKYWAFMKESYDFDTRDIINISAYLQAMGKMVEKNPQIIPTGFVGIGLDGEPVLSKIDGKWYSYVLNVSNMDNLSVHDNIEDAIHAFIKLTPFGISSKKKYKTEVIKTKNDLYMEYADWVEYYELMIKSRDYENLKHVFNVARTFMLGGGDFYKEFEKFKKFNYSL